MVLIEPEDQQGCLDKQVGVAASVPEWRKGQPDPLLLSRFKLALLGSQFAGSLVLCGGQFADDSRTDVDPMHTIAIVARSVVVKLVSMLEPSHGIL